MARQGDRANNPGLHKIPALLKKSGTQIGCLGLALDGVSKRRLSHGISDLGLLGDPVSKGRSKSVGGDARCHPANEFEQRHIREPRFPPRPETRDRSPKPGERAHDETDRLPASKVVRYAERPSYAAFGNGPQSEIVIQF